MASRYRSLLMFAAVALTAALCNVARGALMAQSVSATTRDATAKPTQSVVPTATLAPTVTAAPTDNGNHSASPDLRIGVGDLVEIRIYGVEGSQDVNQSSRVSSDGNIWLPMIEQVHIAGLSTSEAQALIAKRFRDGQFLKNPQILVNVTEYASEGVSVLGEVTKPGIYPLVTARTLLDMISIAGGLTPSGGSHVTITRRSVPNEQINVELGSAQQNIAIMPGDTIVAAKTGIIYVTGEVGKPGGFPLNNNPDMSVLRALALAEGAKPDAALNKAKLIRKTDGKLSETDIPLKKILSGKSADIALRAGDIVFVPNSAAKGAARRSLEAIVQTATGVAIYRP